MTNKKSNILPIVVMYLLFFMIAFVTNLCNPMAVIVKNNFEMSNFAAQLGNAANFIAYAVMGIPAGMLLKKIGYRKTALVAIWSDLSAYSCNTCLAGRLFKVLVYILQALSSQVFVCVCLIR